MKDFEAIKLRIGAAMLQANEDSKLDPEKAMEKLLLGMQKIIGESGVDALDKMNESPAFKVVGGKGEKNED